MFLSPQSPQEQEPVYVEAHLVSQTHSRFMLSTSIETLKSQNVSGNTGSRMNVPGGDMWGAVSDSRAVLGQERKRVLGCCVTATGE